MNEALLAKVSGSLSCKASRPKTQVQADSPERVGATRHLTCCRAQCLASRSSVQGHGCLVVRKSANIIELLVPDQYGSHTWG